MGRIVRLVKVGNALMVSIPREYVRELALHRYGYMQIRRGPGQTLALEKVEPRPDERAARR